MSKSRSSQHPARLVADTFTVSEHAARRQQERGLPDWQVEFALCYGTRVYRHGATLFHVRHKDMPGWLDEQTARRVHGTTVVIVEGTVVTTYRCAGGFHALRCTARHS